MASEMLFLKKKFKLNRHNSSRWQTDGTGLLDRTIEETFKLILNQRQSTYQIDIDMCGQYTYPRIPVSHCNQPSTFHALNMKPCETHRDGKTAFQAKQHHDVTSAGNTSTDVRKKAVLSSAVRMNDTPKRMKELRFG